MIDFQNGSFFKLKQADNGVYDKILLPILVNGEQIISSYKAMRDGVVFTNKRIFSINVQGITGKKVDVTSMPYSKIQVFSIESSGVFDLDSELELYFSGVGKVKFEFTDSSNVSEIGKMISEFVL